MKNEKGQLKSATGYKIANTFKKVGTKILLGLIALGIAIGGTLTFVGCDKDKTPQTPNPPSYVEPENPGGEIDPENPGGDIEIQEKTYQDFLQSGLADVFVDGFAPKALAQKGELWGKEYFVTGHDNVVTGINFLYIYGDPATEYRTIEIANLKFTSDLDVDDILTDINLSTSYKLSTQKVMEFNAKTNKLNPDIANALYNAANLKNQTLKLFQEVENNRESYRTFTLFSQNADNSIQLVELTVESDETNLLENLANSAKVTVKNGKTYLSEGNNVLSDKYTLDEETYKPEEVGPGGEIDPPGPGGEVVKPEISDKEIIEAFKTSENLSTKLTDYFQENQFLTFNASKVENENWYVNYDEKGNITKVIYSMNYNYSNTTNYFAVFSISLNPISKEDLKANGLSNIKLKEEYCVNYDPTIQEGLKNIKDEILTHLGYSTDSLCFVIQKGGTETSQAYTIVIIEDDVIKEYTVSKDHKTNNYTNLSDKTVNIQGKKLAETDNQDSALDGEEYSF